MAHKKYDEDINKIKPDNYNPRQMKNTANSFLATVHMCNMNPTVEMVGWGHPMIVPIVTNAAFSCELFLKALLKKAIGLSIPIGYLIYFKLCQEK